MSWIQTYTGKAFYHMSPRPEQVDIRDIAHHLAATNRFNGALRRPISVAQHSVMVARHLSTEDAIHGLLHDAHEAYMPDFARPLKHIWHAHFQQYPPFIVTVNTVEVRILRCIYDALHLHYPGLHAQNRIHIEDARCLMTEKRDLMSKEPMPWSVCADPWPERMCSWPYRRAEKEFLHVYKHLKGTAR